MLHIALALCSSKATAHLFEVNITPDVTTEVADMLMSSLKMLQKLHLRMLPSTEQQQPWCPAGSSSLLELQLEVNQDAHDETYIDLDLCGVARCEQLQVLVLDWCNILHWEAIASLEHLRKLSGYGFLQAPEVMRRVMPHIAKLRLL